MHFIALVFPFFGLEGIINLYTRTLGKKKHHIRLYEWEMNGNILYVYYLASKSLIFSLEYHNELKCQWRKYICSYEGKVVIMQQESFSKLTVTVQPKENKIFGGFLVIILRVRWSSSTAKFNYRRKEKRLLYLNKFCLLECRYWHFPRFSPRARARTKVAGNGWTQTSATISELGYRPKLWNERVSFPFPKTSSENTR